MQLLSALADRCSFACRYRVCCLPQMQTLVWDKGSQIQASKSLHWDKEISNFWNDPLVELHGASMEITHGTTSVFSNFRERVAMVKFVSVIGIFVSGRKRAQAGSAITEMSKGVGRAAPGSGPRGERQLPAGRGLGQSPNRGPGWKTPAAARTPDYGWGTQIPARPFFSGRSEAGFSPDFASGFGR